jgi:hypothetical protein
VTSLLATPLITVATESGRLKGGPGLLALVIFLALVVACVILYRSMRRHLRRVDFDKPPEDQQGEPPEPGSSGG